MSCQCEVTPLHVTNAPALRDAIVRGDFDALACPACGARVQQARVLAYTDFARKQWFAVFPEQALATWRDAAAYVETSFRTSVEEHERPEIHACVPALRPGIRAVFGMSSLREKLRIADAGLDDRILEVLKLDVLDWYDLAEGDVWFSHREDDVLVFAWRASPDAAWALYPVPFDAYLRRLCDLDATRARAPRLHESAAIDFRIER